MSLRTFFYATGLFLCCLTITIAGFSAYGDLKWYGLVPDPGSSKNEQPREVGVRPFLFGQLMWWQGKRTNPWSVSMIMSVWAIQLCSSLKRRTTGPRDVAIFSTVLVGCIIAMTLFVRFTSGKELTLQERLHPILPGNQLLAIGVCIAGLYWLNLNEESK